MFDAICWNRASLSRCSRNARIKNCVPSNVTATKPVATATISTVGSSSPRSLARTTTRRRAAAIAGRTIEKAHRQDSITRLEGCSARGGSSCSIAMPSGAVPGAKTAGPSESQTASISLSGLACGRCYAAPSSGSNTREIGFPCVDHHATIGVAAARGGPFRRHVLWRAVRDQAPVGGLLQTPLLGVRSSAPLHFVLQYKRLAWRPAVRRALAPSPLVAPHLRFDLSEADSCPLRYCKGHG